MKYDEVFPAFFVSRPNRFIANVRLGQDILAVHVKNTGRCHELLIPGCKVYLAGGKNPQRKTKYDLIAVEKITPHGTLLINMDSQAPNQVAYEFFRQYYQTSLKIIKPEYSWRGDQGQILSRFDHYVEYIDQNNQTRRKLWEVKGCTLEENGVALFPDAPTIRGTKHLHHLRQIALQGEYECGLLLVIQMSGCYEFRPNWQMDPKFSQALVEAATSGVDIRAVSCVVQEDSLVATNWLPVILQP